MNLMPLMPEIFILSSACFILVLDLFLPMSFKRITYFLSLLTMGAAAILTMLLMKQPAMQLFNNAFVLDKTGSLLKLSIYSIGFFIFIYSRSYMIQRDIVKGEYYALSLFSILGAMILVSAKSFLTLYLGVELVTLPLFALVAISKENSLGEEAALKYFVMGAMATGMMLYGISLLYGASGSFDVHTVATYLSSHAGHSKWIVLTGLVLILAGLGFKFGAVPFHMWIPDVYQGAPTSVTIFIGTLPKLAGFGFALRLLIDAFPSISGLWQPIILIMAILSLILGNTVAIVQSNLKRLLAYSTIGHIGFIFLGLIAGPQSGYAAAFVYVIIYAIMTLGAFGIMMSLSHSGFEAENIEDFKGLGSKQPWTAFMMMLILLSLAGIPPLAGFYAKFLVLDAIVKAGFIWPAVVAVILTVVGAYYYLRVIKVMFFDAPTDEIQYQPVSNQSLVLMSLNGIMILLLGIFPAPLFNLCIMVLNNN